MKNILSPNGINFEQYGDGENTLLLIHGLAANAAVWDPLLEIAQSDWDGKIIVPDLRGHGKSAHKSLYSLAAMACDLVEIIQHEDKVSIIGHSLGGALAGLLGTGWFGLDIDKILALSVKVQWTNEEISGGKKVASKPTRLFDTQEEAENWFLRVSGLVQSASDMQRSVDLGTQKVDGKYCLTADPKIFGCAALGVTNALNAVQSKIKYATGGTDAIATEAGFQAEGIPVSIIENVGHQLHVEKPLNVWQLFSDMHENKA